ncbi:hypothetical protein G5V59_27315 [Nocardioides sp. W3-2-3]|uniref:hypothetical protein n=1 Tax=Nocardioides convexus TaxID=2712224 RepID=UPI0024182CA2|nr:hypothetical protein [Nocardioides convexus]NHA02093.1 hypothetical protein [Nocardioides convexus]
MTATVIAAVFAGLVVSAYGRHDARRRHLRPGSPAQPGDRRAVGPAGDRDGRGWPARGRARHQPDGLEPSDPTQHGKGNAAMATTTQTGQETVAGPPKRRRGGLLLALLALVVAFVVAVTVLTGGDDKPTTADPGPAPLPKGLAVGDATATFDLATREVGGVPRGFPQTLAGAVEASAASLEATRTAGYEPAAPDRAAVQKEFGYDKASDIDEVIAAAQARDGLDGNGQPLDGEPGDRFYNECLPQYGMYRTMRGDALQTNNSDAPIPTPPTDVWVLTWAPCIEGIGSPTHIDNLRVKWNVYPLRWKWAANDWRLAVDDKWEWPEKDVPTPKDLLRPNVSLQERADLFGDGGWLLFKGYSEAWPTDLLGKEPGA